MAKKASLFSVALFITEAERKHISPKLFKTMKAAHDRAHRKVHDTKRH
jgi:hypothetical protein